jgi:hypothetical protein
MRFAFKGMLPSLAIPFTLPIITLPRRYFPHPRSRIHESNLYD